MRLCCCCCCSCNLFLCSCCGFCWNCGAPSPSGLEDCMIETFFCKRTPCVCQVEGGSPNEKSPTVCCDSLCPIHRRHCAPFHACLLPTSQRVLVWEGKVTWIEMMIADVTSIADVTLIAAVTLTSTLSVNHLTWSRSLNVTLTPQS